jgi:hypothetical protein
MTTKEQAAESIAEACRQAYLEGCKDGIRAFAHWKDGEQYVGTGGLKLTEALREVDRDGGLKWVRDSAQVIKSVLKKKLLAVVLAGVVLFTLAGCRVTSHGIRYKCPCGKEHTFPMNRPLSRGDVGGIL